MHDIHDASDVLRKANAPARILLRLIDECGTVKDLANRLKNRSGGRRGEVLGISEAWGPAGPKRP